jgi:hypothetical protein
MMVVMTMVVRGRGECGACKRNQQQGSENQLLHCKNVARDWLLRYRMAVAASRDETVARGSVRPGKSVN